MFCCESGRGQKARTMGGGCCDGRGNPGAPLGGGAPLETKPSLGTIRMEISDIYEKAVFAKPGSAHQAVSRRELIAAACKYARPRHEELGLVEQSEGFWGFLGLGAITQHTEASWAEHMCDSIYYSVKGRDKTEDLNLHAFVASVLAAYGKQDIVDPIGRIPVLELNGAFMGLVKENRQAQTLTPPSIGAC
jgi:hypothetical protein